MACPNHCQNTSPVAPDITINNNTTVIEIGDDELEFVNEPITRQAGQHKIFDLSLVPVAADEVLLMIEGLPQESGTDYTVQAADKTVTFVEDVPEDVTVTAKYMGVSE